jgi:hypothetical protein
MVTINNFTFNPMKTHDRFLYEDKVSTSMQFEDLHLSKLEAKAAP